MFVDVHKIYTVVPYIGLRLRNSFRNNFSIVWRVCDEYENSTILSKIKKSVKEDRHSF